MRQRTAGFDDLRAAIERLPDRLAAAMQLDWSLALNALCEATSLVSLGRGPTLAIAREAALKLKETANLHAEAFSSAEATPARDCGTACMTALVSGTFIRPAPAPKSMKPGSRLT